MCTLIAALQQAGAMPGHHTIRFSVPVVPPARSFGGVFTQASGITIEGPVTIDMGLGLTNVGDAWGLWFSGVPTFHVRNVWIKGTGSRSFGYGSSQIGILVDGTTPVSGCTVEGSTITGLFRPLIVDSTAAASGCSFVNNRIGIDPSGIAVGNGAAVAISGTAHQLIGNTISA